MVDIKTGLLHILSSPVHAAICNFSLSNYLLSS